jgi:hypothetical protein
MHHPKADIDYIQKGKKREEACTNRSDIRV